MYTSILILLHFSGELSHVGNVMPTIVSFNILPLLFSPSSTWSLNLLYCHSTKFIMYYNNQNNLYLAFNFKIKLFLYTV